MDSAAFSVKREKSRVLMAEKWNYQEGKKAEGGSGQEKCGNQGIRNGSSDLVTEGTEREEGTEIGERKADDGRERREGRTEGLPHGTQRAHSAVWQNLREDRSYVFYAFFAVKGCLMNRNTDGGRKARPTIGNRKGLSAL